MPPKTSIDPYINTDSTVLLYRRIPEVVNAIEMADSISLTFTELMPKSIKSIKDSLSKFSDYEEESCISGENYMTFINNFPSLLEQLFSSIEQHYKQNTRPQHPIEKIFSHLKEKENYLLKLCEEYVELFTQFTEKNDSHGDAIVKSAILCTDPSLTDEKFEQTFTEVQNIVAEREKLFTLLKKQETLIHSYYEKNFKLSPKTIINQIPQ